MHVGQRHLGGRDEVIALRRAEQILFELGKLPGRRQRFPVGQDGREDLRVPVLARMQVEHEGRERP